MRKQSKQVTGDQKTCSRFLRIYIVFHRICELRIWSPEDPPLKFYWFWCPNALRSKSFEDQTHWAAIKCGSKDGFWSIKWLLLVHQMTALVNQMTALGPSNSSFWSSNSGQYKEFQQKREERSGLWLERAFIHNLAWISWQEFQQETRLTVKHIA